MLVHWKEPLEYQNGYISNNPHTAFVTHEGLAPPVWPWENGMRTNPMLGTFKWWYLQGTFDDGSHV